MQARRSPLTAVDDLAGWMLDSRRARPLSWLLALYTILAALVDAGIVFVVAGAVATVLCTFGGWLDERLAR